MTAQCPSCGRGQEFGLLCAEDSTVVLQMLAAVPQLVEQLDVAISRQAKVGSGGKAGKGSIHERNPINFGALAAKDALLIAVAFVGDDIDALRKHPQVAEMVCDLGRTVKAAYRAIDRAQERQYLGTCGYTEDGATCHAELWARESALTALCSQCSTEHDVRERQQWMLDAAEDMLMSVRDAAQAIGSYAHLNVTESTIRSYVSKGKVAYHGKVEGSSVLRLGDLLAVIREHAARESGRRLRQSA